jgi:hypothetical protein
MGFTAETQRTRSRRETRIENGGLRIVRDIAPAVLRTILHPLPSILVFPLRALCVSAVIHF